MTRFLTLFLLLYFTNSFCQAERELKCKVEIYLLKSRKPTLDTTLKLIGGFLVTNSDLADTPFIKNHEIFGCVFKNDTINYENSILIDNRHLFEVHSSVIERINNLKIPLCCGRQFALTINGRIIYGGYFWNLVSSWGCGSITAFAYDSTIEILRKIPDFDYQNDLHDPRNNSILIECLSKRKRLFK